MDEMTKRMNDLHNKLLKSSFSVGDAKNLIPRNYQMADRQYEIIRDAIEAFEKRLDSDSEVFMQLAQFGSSVTIAISAIGYSNPSLMHFYGQTPDGLKVELIQHINQISFLLLAQKKKNENLPTRPIGFLQEVTPVVESNTKSDK